MAERKFTELQEKTALADNDIVAIADSEVPGIGASKKAKLATIKDYLRLGLARADFFVDEKNMDILHTPADGKDQGLISAFTGASLAQSLNAAFRQIPGRGMGILEAGIYEISARLVLEVSGTGEGGLDVALRLMQRGGGAADNRNYPPTFSFVEEAYVGRGINYYSAPLTLPGSQTRLSIRYYPLEDTGNADRGKWEVIWPTGITVSGLPKEIKALRLKIGNEDSFDIAVTREALQTYSVISSAAAPGNPRGLNPAQSGDTAQLTFNMVFEDDTTLYAEPEIVYQAVGRARGFGDAEIDNVPVSLSLGLLSLERPAPDGAFIDLAVSYAGKRTNSLAFAVGENTSYLTVKRLVLGAS